VRTRIEAFADGLIFFTQGLVMNTSKFVTLRRAILVACVCAATGSWAQTTTAAKPAAKAAVQVEGAWARATVPGQSGTGAFMSLTAAQTTRLVGVASPVAGVAELHEMKMVGDIMKMSAIAGLDLPAGQAVLLKPGSYHLMLMDLKRPLAKDSTVPVTLRFKDAKGVESQLELVLPVGTMPPAGAASAKAPAKEPAHKH
jgi:copper(I)-binding protein